MKPQPLLILGTRTFASEVADLISEINEFELEGFVENMERERCQETLEGLPIRWVGEILPLAKTHLAVCALATTHRRAFVEEVANLGFRFATIIHPSARISTRASLGEGSIVNRNVVIATHTHLGRHVQVNRGALIGHHSQIGDYATIQPGANIAGCCHIAESVYIGMGAVILDHLRVGAHSVVGAGAVVTTEVAPRVQVVGVPARVVKENINGK